MRAAFVAAALGAAVGVGISAPTDVAADDFISWARIAPGAPNCQSHPENRILGRISGLAGDERTHAAFAGCFPDQASCEAWLRNARDNLSPPFATNSCEPRSS